MVMTAQVPRVCRYGSARTPGSRGLASREGVAGPQLVWVVPVAREKVENAGNLILPASPGQARLISDVAVSALLIDGQDRQY